jgi:hypothetical protein
MISGQVVGVVVLWYGASLPNACPQVRQSRLAAQAILHVILYNTL